MKTNPAPWSKGGETRFKSGKIGWILLWLIGIPVPILLIFFLLRGCT